MAYIPGENYWGGNGYIRLVCNETVNADQNTSTVEFNLQINPNVGVTYYLYGQISIDGANTSINKNVGGCPYGKWTTIWSATKTIEHKDDGTKAVAIVINPIGSFTSGLTAQGQYNGSYYNIVLPKGTYYLSLTDIEVGSTVRIEDGSEFREYFIYLDDGTELKKCDAYIDNGSSWEKI